ncbi:hypothetical protein N7451_011104 [Penicillium sp. IBT 35674x]|nr:hypothetical protein N7451_011104 [Penicillium sp. IBT 35674x]
MSLLLAPYNNAMRIGQGFNSYTQQICIDDAVVIDPNRSENVVTNDGTTMRIMAQKSGTPSAWTRQKEVLVEDPATVILEAKAEKAKAEVKMIEEQLADEEAEETPESEPAPKPEATKQKLAVEALEDDEQPDEQPEDSSKETDSIVEVTDADEAQTDVEDQTPEPELTGSKAIEEVGETEGADVEYEPADESEVKPSETRGRATSSSKELLGTPIPDRADNLVRLEARGKKATKASVSGEKDNGKAITEKAFQPQGDDDEVDREAIMANLHANAEKPHDRDDTVSHLAANPRKSVKRSLSADRARSQIAEKSTSPPDRAAIRAALNKTKSAFTPVRSAQERAEAARREQEEKKVLDEDRAYRRKLDLEARKEEQERRAEEREEQRSIRAEKRQWDAKRREDARKAIENAANLEATSLADLEKIRAQNQFVERFNGMPEQTTKYDFDPTAPRGPSQTVIYTSRFVDRLSDVMDDMSVSGSLSIKAGKIGGSGKGSFVDSDKFKESDLNFYISVKVINQTVNFKDALVFNPLRSVDKENFREVYGDSFISGFLEGGEFNALVSMKILNKAKKTDIQAEAKVALTAGTVQIEAEANVGVARSNIETNTETTIQVSWCGGGHIKPMEQQWDIKSLMEAAARFPDLVAECPQRTYAILTKYDALRSFVARKPASYTALQYENAQLYTSTLLDTFVSYKALYKRLGEQIFQVQGKTMEIQQWSDEKSTSKTGANDNDQQKKGGISDKESKVLVKDAKTGFYPYKEEIYHFDATVKGLSDARRAVRKQMARIVNEVNLIEMDPKLATDEDHEEPFQATTAFEARIPTVVVPERLRIKAHPLSGRRIMAKALTEEEQLKAIEEDDKLAEGAPLFTANDKLSEEEQKAMQSLISNDPIIGESFRVSSAAGDEFQGKPFNNLDYLKQDWEIRAIRAEVAEGALVYLAVSYENGLLVEKGASRDGSRVKKFGPFFPGERINSASIEHGKRVGEKNSQILGLRLFTNRGRGLIARALHSEPGSIPAPSGSTKSEPQKTVIRDGVHYENVNVLYLDVPFNPGSIKGFFGRSDDSSQNSRIWRLGIVWCRTAEGAADDTTEHFGDAGDVIDREDLALLQKDQNAGSKMLQETQNKLAAAEKALDEARKYNSEKDKQIQKLTDERDKELSRNVYAQSGIVHGEQKGWRPGVNSLGRVSQTFPQAYSKSPKLIFGLANIDCDQNTRNRSMAVSIPEITPSEFTVQVASFNGCNAYGIDCSWMTLPDDLHLEHGSVDTHGTGVDYNDNFRQRVVFGQRFASPPKICVWLQEIDYPSHQEPGFGGNVLTSIIVNADNITDNCFTLNILSWSNRKYRSVRAGWLAYPAEEDGKRVKSARNSVARAQKTLKQSAPFYGQPFLRTPATFIAISKLDFGHDANLRMGCRANAPNPQSLEWEFGTWADSNMESAEVTWIAIE